MLAKLKGPLRPSGSFNFSDIPCLLTRKAGHMITRLKEPADSSGQRGTCFIDVDLAGHHV